MSAIACLKGNSLKTPFLASHYANTPRKQKGTFLKRDFIFRSANEFHSSKVTTVFKLLLPVWFQKSEMKKADPNFGLILGYGSKPNI